MIPLSKDRFRGLHGSRLAGIRRACIRRTRVPSLRDLDPIQLSRQLAAVSERYVSFRRALKFGPATLHPFLGEFPGRTHLRFVQDLPEGDPLRSQLLRWTYFLLDARIQVPWESAEADLLYRRRHYIKEPLEGHFTLAELSSLALDGRKGSPALWWRQRARFESELSDHRKQLFLRREEVAERAQFGDVGAFYNPLTDGARPTELAELVLRQTRDEAESQWESGFAAFVETAQAKEASEGWPARLAPDSLRELFFESVLFRGVEVKLAFLPARHNPMSFVRAAASLGAHLNHRLAPRDLPFVIAHDPHELPDLRFGELFALWAMSGPFLRRRLKLSSSKTYEALRAIRRAHVCHLRLLALKVLVRDLARSRALTEKWGALTFAFCREELPPSSALARFEVPENSAARLVAHLSALGAAHELRHRYDEDWYENPRAQEELRDEARRPAFSQVSRPACEGGLEIFRKELR